MSEKKVHADALRRYYVDHAEAEDDQAKIDTRFARVFKYGQEFHEYWKAYAPEALQPVSDSIIEKAQTTENLYTNLAVCRQELAHLFRDAHKTYFPEA